MKEACTLSTMDFSGLNWRKSSRSTSAGDNGNCVEIAFTDDWRKSSYSTANGSNGACVEVNLAGPVVAVRDSKNPGATPLAIPATAFTNFLRSV
jgi:hypothetical protein